MELGLCPRCATPYTSSDVAGFGILRGRSARRGGPRVEYACQGCGHRIHLIPHGSGRYAPPGQPPPAAVPRAERAPPWMRGASPGGDGGPEAPPRRADPREAPRPPRDPEPPPPPPEPEPEPLRVPPPPDPDAPVGVAEARELLGVETGADRAAIERAFRERSLACHPDKVAHLDEDFQALAEAKFRRLQKALARLLGED